MSAGRVAVRYAKALIDALEEKKGQDQIESFYQFCDVVDRNAELKTLYANVTVSNQGKAAVTEAIGKKMGLGEVVQRFNTILALNGRMNFLREVRETVARLLDERKHIQSVRLTTSMPLTAEELGSFQANMERALDSRVRVTTEVDASILGGAVARVGSYVYDGSVSGRLNRLRKELVKEN